MNSKPRTISRSGQDISITWTTGGRSKPYNDEILSYNLNEMRQIRDFKQSVIEARHTFVAYSI